MNFVFTVKSLFACLGHGADDAWFATADVPADGSWDVLATDRDASHYVIHRDDPRDAARVIIVGADPSPFQPMPQAAWRAAAQRVHRAALSAQHPPFRLPSGWSEFHEGNLVAFFAAPWVYGAFRWIIEIGADASHDVCFWALTDASNEVALANFKPDYRVLRRITSQWGAAFATVSEALAKLPKAEAIASLQAAVDLDVTTFGAVTQFKTYSAWLEKITPKQREFVEHSIAHSVKLRGPAGSGKTLVLELKALRELYAAREAKQHRRILFATHSWAAAEQVDGSLRTMDESGDTAEIEIFPLVEIAKAGLPTERGVSGYRLLGEDSLSGKRYQLERIDDTLEKMVRGDWITYRSLASVPFRSRVESARGSPERNALVWDLMNEFSSVLSAHGILPGINAERRYLAIQRSQWMMPLDAKADKRFVLEVYSRYVESLKAARVLTSDQLINDFLNYLETFTWNLRREKEGYDLIFVDELHLFNEQERLVLSYLTKSPEEYPKMFMALDPRQSPSEVYANMPMARVATGLSGTSDQYLGDVSSVELSTVHRFTPEILALVRHIHQTYPALDLGSDWQIDVEAIESSASHGERPSLFVHETRDQECAGVLRRAKSVSESIGGEARVAVVVLDPLALPRFEAAAGKGAFSVIQGRDDVETLRYTRRSIVLSAAEYVAGLQFDYLIIAGFPETPQSVANLGHQRRRFLSLLYLAVSRARQFVELHVSEDNGGVPDLLESAVKNEIVVLG